MSTDQMLYDLVGGGSVFYIDTRNGNRGRRSAVNKDDWELSLIPLSQPFLVQCVREDDHPIRILRPERWINFAAQLWWLSGNQ